jgi:phosphoribosylformylglycinamidine synthase
MTAAVPRPGSDDLAQVRVGIVTFPGSLDDGDAARAVRLAGGSPVALWHGTHDLDSVDAVILPGGFSYGDYLRAGAIASFSPIMREVIDAAKRGVPVLGICNGFQVLCESGLLPGALTRNAHLHFRNRDQRLRIAARTAWTGDFAEGVEIVVPARYVGGNPNGSARNIAGVTDPTGRIVGLMPHPEHAVEELTGPSTDGLGFFTSILVSISRTGAGRAA